MDAPLGNRHGTCRWMILAMAICLAFLLTCTAVARADAAAMLWLLEGQHGDGRFASAADETTADHATFEALHALHPAHGASPEWASARAFVDAAASSGIPALPRRLLAARLANESGAALLADLLLHQSADGGFAAEPGDQSSLLDTVDALEALGAIGVRDRTVLRPAVTYVLERQGADGGFALNAASPTSAYLTARVIESLRRYQFEFGLSQPLRAASAFLWAELGLGAGDGYWEMAQGLLALMPVTADPGRYQDLLDELRIGQAPDGSWAGSVYSTALALRALAKAESNGALAAPGSGAISGRVVGAVGGNPVAGASVTVEGIETGGTAVSDPDGRFLVEDLDAGEYTLRISATGFQPLSHGVELTPGLVLELGSVSVALKPGLGLISGTVTDSETGHGLAAGIEAVGDDARSVSAATDGRYALPVPAGQIQLSVSAPGYQDVQASASVAAGDRLVFSPALGRETVTDPDATVKITGRLLDANSLEPISGAAVRVGDAGAVAVSDANGVFIVPGLPAGEILLELLHASYRTALLRVLAIAGTELELGDLFLQYDDLPGTTVKGQVIDGYTGAPVTGAAVRIGDLVVETDDLGQYRLDALSDLIFEVRVSAQGYRTMSRELRLQQPGVFELDFSLDPTEGDGVLITGIVSHAETVTAFEEARFSVALENRAEDIRRVIVSATVEGIDNGFREDFVVPASGADRTGSFGLTPGETLLAEFGWFSRHLDPGPYRLRVQAWSPDGATLLDEASTGIAIAETRAVTSLRFQAAPRESVRGEPVQVALSALVRNGSNVPSVLKFTVVLLDPSRRVLHERPVRLDLPPASGTLSFELEPLSYVFESAGTYAVGAQSLSGVPVESLHSTQVVVAPNIRIQGSHGLEPEQILPLEDARVRIRLEIEGTEDGQ